ncbi:MAG TPA: hypothetical protein VM221_10430 [Armatimonadota bacterium]|nr:hypothetical protein [Armatimonadota bacterium]
MTRRARRGLSILALTIAVVAAVALPAAGDQNGAATPLDMTLKDASLQEVLRAIATAQGADIVMTDDVQGTISLSVAQKTAEEILDLIASTRNLHWWKENGAYVVSGQPRSVSTDSHIGESASPKTARAANQRVVIPLRFNNAQDLAYQFGGAAEPYTPSSRSFDEIIYPYGPPGQPVGNRVEGAQPQSPRAKTAAVPRNPYDELRQRGGGIEEMQPTAGTPAGPGGEEEMVTAGGPLGHLLPAELSPPVAYAPLNALIVQGPMEAIEEFRKLVEQLDVRVPQVMVEAQFVEMRVDDARQFGINWSWIGGETGVDVTGQSTGGNVGISFVKGRFTALLQSLLDTSRARIINAPRLATMNMQRVAFTISRTFFYFTSDTVVQTPTFAGSQVFTTSRLNALPVVTTFEIMPQVNGDDSITVDVSTIISDVAGFITGPNGEKIPEPTATALPTRLRVQNGETIVMGGFVRKNVSETKHKVPLLSDIPIIGKWLFTGSSFTQSDSELLIFLTARIMEEKGDTAAREEGGSSFMTMPLGQ